MGEDDRIMESTPDAMTDALARTLSTLQGGSLDAFLKAMAEARGASEPVRDWQVIDCILDNGIPRPLKQLDHDNVLWRELIFAAERQGGIRGGAVLGDGLALVVHGASDRPTRLICGSDAALLDAVGELVIAAPLSASERRLLKQLVCGFNLTAAAELDGVGHETKRSQFKSLARKLGGGSQTEIAGKALTCILLELASSVSGRNALQDDYFDDLLREFAPRARTLRLRGPSGAGHRFVDVGPVGGRPVVMLHPQVLPDFRDSDIDALSAHSVRFIIPLRNGAMSIDTTTMDVSNHLDHACEGIELARIHFSGEQVDLMACISGTAYGLEYARRFPERVSSLAFVGATVKPTTAKSMAGKLRSGLFTLSMNQWRLYSKLMDFYGRRIRRPETLRQLLAGIYRPNLADLAVIDAEYGAPFGGERLRKFFTSSVQSIKHDFYHQALPDWSDFPAPTYRVAFFHGAQDFIHPIVEVRRLAQSLGGIPVTSLPAAGQLLYHDHFAPLLRVYRTFLDHRPSD